MKFLITATIDPNAKKPAEEAPFNEDLFAAYMKFNEDMHNAGILIASEGLNPGKKGARVGVKNGKRVLLDGPFVETKELVGGFYLIDVASREEAIAWAMRCPTGFGSDDLLTIHALTEAEDIPADLMALTKKVAPNWVKSFQKPSP